MFKYIENDNPLKSKQLNKGIEQLTDEGVAQLFVGKTSTRKIIGTVGALQFEVIQYRLLHEYGAQCHYEPITLYKTAWVSSDNPKAMEDFVKHKSAAMAVDKDGRLVFLAETRYALELTMDKYKEINFHFTSEF